MTGVFALQFVSKVNLFDFYRGGEAEPFQEPLRGLDIVEYSSQYSCKASERLPDYETELFSKEESILESVEKFMHEYEALVKQCSLAWGELLEYLP